MPAKKTIKKSSEMMMDMSCCASWIGIIHAVAGVGIGFLLASYIAIPSLVTWGWVLVALGVLGHVLGWTKCRKCGL